MIARLMALMLWLLPMAVQAQVELGTYKTIETRFGVIGVVWRPEGAESVLWNTQEIPGLETAEITIGGGYALQGEAFDWVVLNTRHRGNMCPYAFVILKVSAAGVQRTQQFGDCLGGLLDLQVLPGRLRMDIADRDTRYERQVFVFDGASLTQQAVPRATPTERAGAGPAVTRWAGKSFSEVLADPTERGRFLTILNADLLEDLRRASDVSSGAVLSGNWLIGQGCQRHLCNAVAGLWAIRISDGAPFGAFLYGKGTPMSVHGDGSLLTDPVLNAALMQAQAKMLQ